MNEIRLNVSERQMDVLAGRVAELERKVEALLDLLMGKATLRRMGLSGSSFDEVRRSFLTQQSGELRHFNERAKTIREKQRDELAGRLEFVSRELSRAVPVKSSDDPDRTKAGRARRNRGRGRVA